jgi:DNA invertase Pin-like site-specific DNA recombinase
MSRNRPPGHANRGVRLCEHCGGRHYTRGERTKCENDHAAPKPPVEARQGSPTTRYSNDPLGGDQRAHMIARKLNDGMSVRKVAKRYDIPVATVQNIQKKLKGKK